MSGTQAAMYSLEEIAGCEDAGRHLSLPQIQRGLVWKAAQIELLWDSILRGFPIGSFVVAEFSDNNSENSLQLLDGQQRMNAIKLGYKQFSDLENVEQQPVLWFDLAPKIDTPSSRKYWVRLCTPAHPWGYEANDKCSTLKTHKKRDACEIYGASDSFKPKTHEAWPYDASCPIPFIYLITAAKNTSDEHSFVDEVIASIRNETQQKLPVVKDSEFIDIARAALEKNKTDLYEAFRRLTEYRVSTVALPEGFLKEETDEDQQGSMECFFERMNTGGTRISSEDLFYSTVKANFKELNLKEKCDELAEKVMPPSHLAILSFRLALTNLDKHENSKKLRGRPDLSAIRKIAREEGPDYQAIETLWQGSQINQSLRTVLDWISYDKTKRQKGLLPVLRLSLILHSSDVFLLLLWLANKNDQLDRDVALQLATLLHWFAIDKNKACNVIIEECSKEGGATEAIQRGIAFAISENHLLVPYSSNILEKETYWEWSEGWSWWGIFGEETPCMDWINRIKDNGLKAGTTANELILYAQREYLDRTFGGYNPADPVLFGESNRPWDMDHIIPKSWVVGAKGRPRTPWLGLCEQWANLSGNLAAIPFEINRSKNDGDDWAVYEANAQGLLFPPHETTRSIRESGDMTMRFASWAKDRMIRIYDSWYDGLEMDRLLCFDEKSLPKHVADRRSLFLKIKDALGEHAKCFFVQGVREYPIKQDNDIHFCKEWLSVGIEVEKGLVCLTSNARSYEIGVRKAPHLDSVDCGYLPDCMKELAATRDYTHQNGGWWYVVRSFNDAPVKDMEAMLVEELKSLYSDYATKFSNGQYSYKGDGKI